MYAGDLDHRPKSSKIWAWGICAGGILAICCVGSNFQRFFFGFFFCPKGKKKILKKIFQNCDPYDFSPIFEIWIPRGVKVLLELLTLGVDSEENLFRV